MNELKRILHSVIYQLYANALLVSLLLCLTFYLLIAAFRSPGIEAMVAGVAGLGLGFYITRIFQSKKAQAVQIIHQKLEDTEYSLALLDKTDYTIAEQLQLARLDDRFADTSAPKVIFLRIFPYLGICILAIGIYAFSGTLSSTSAAASLDTKPSINPSKPANEPPVFLQARIKIQSPAYTGIPEKSSTDLNVTAYVGSKLSWQVNFDTNRKLSVCLINSKGEELVFKPVKNYFEYTDRLSNAGIYAIKAYWQNPEGKKMVVYQSDYYRLEALLDKAPKIEPESKELYTYHFQKDSKTVTLAAKISDDFLVRQTYIVATLARGTGENVKFREVRFPLSPTNFKESRLTKTIDLKSLDFTPGDELYYYWAAFDTKQPEPNFSKSDTYFIVYRDSTHLEESDLATMSVNLLPEYFRSQRQIIIDTEKLIAKRKKIHTSEFQYLSNAIGFDQKALRLRYGQFLGEEFENSIGGHDLQPDGNVLEGYIHKHDSENEEAKAFAFKLGQQAEGQSHAVERPGEGHAHDHGGAGASEDKDPLAALMEQYVHNHDDGELNTFHEQSTKTLLKMAVEQMWQSELHLRMYEPEKALPIEKKALEYLKQAQHKARSFVKKSSSDPPPIKEKEKRLTGELLNVNVQVIQERKYASQTLTTLASEVSGYLEQATLTVPEKQKIQQLSSKLSDSRNWTALNHLQKWLNSGSLSLAEKRELKTQLLTLSKPVWQTRRSHAGSKKLEQAFWKNLQ